MLVIRLQRAGKKNQPFFRVVLTEKTSPVRGKFLEKLGFLNPVKKEISINKERTNYWISKGAKISDSVYNILIEKKILEGKKRFIKIKKKKTKKEGAEKEGEKKKESQENNNPQNPSPEKEEEKGKPEGENDKTEKKEEKPKEN